MRIYGVSGAASPVAHLKRLEGVVMVDVRFLHLLAFAFLIAACRPRPETPPPAPAATPAREPTRIRITGPTGPHTPPALFVIDGVIYRPPFDLPTLDPDSILTVEIFRGEEAVKRFGSEAAAGVVVITMKKDAPLPPPDPPGYGATGSPAPGLTAANR